MSSRLLILLFGLLATCLAIYNGDSRFPIFRSGTNFICKQKVTLKDFRDWKVEKPTVDHITKMFGLSLNDFIIINPELVPIAPELLLTGYINEKTQFCVAGYWLAK